MSRPPLITFDEEIPEEGLNIWLYHSPLILHALAKIENIFGQI